MALAAASLDSGESKTTSMRATVASALNSSGRRSAVIVVSLQLAAPHGVVMVATWAACTGHTAARAASMNPAGCCARVPVRARRTIVPAALFSWVRFAALSRSATCWDSVPGRVGRSL